MTFIVQCDSCGKTQEALSNRIGEPINPFNNETGEHWYSKVREDGKTIHACCREHIPTGDLAMAL